MMQQSTDEILFILEDMKNQTKKASHVAAGNGKAYFYNESQLMAAHATIEALLRETKRVGGVQTAIQILGKTQSGAQLDIFSKPTDF